MKLVSPYFLAKYPNGLPRDVQSRKINGVWYRVERFNHGLAHSLRQGALAKDIIDALASMKIDDHPFLNWVRSQRNQKNFMAKVEMAASFQRSGRKSDIAGSLNPSLYKEYELQDMHNFEKAAVASKLFTNQNEIDIFKEAILWSNRGILDENTHLDLKYLRCILHAAHTLDLRRILAFDEKRIKKDALEQLFDEKTISKDEVQKLINDLWSRSGQYLAATGDRDLTTRRWLTDTFFIQSKYPQKMVDAIHRVRMQVLTTVPYFTN